MKLKKNKQTAESKDAVIAIMQHQYDEMVALDQRLLNAEREAHAATSQQLRRGGTRAGHDQTKDRLADV